MVDYEEQALCAGIKANQQCSACTVPPDERGDLTQTWPMRTHASMQEQMRRQRETDIPKKDAAWVHPRKNFAWKHVYVNIHESFTPDPLHQLYKGTVMHCIQWVQMLLEERYPRRRLRGTGRRSIWQASGLVQLERRFKMVPRFPGLKILQKFSAINQWTGVEQKAMVDQLVPVLAPLLKDDPAAMHYVRALVDFIMLVRYRTHDDDTIGYMKICLRRMAYLARPAFAKYRPGDKAKIGFNIPKFHVMVHYPYWLKLYGCPDGFCTSHGEAAHKYCVKDFYPRTDRKDYLVQILYHNTRRVKMLAMADVLLYRDSKATTKVPVDQELHVTRVSRAINLGQCLSKRLTTREASRLYTLGIRDARSWRSAGLLEERFQIPNFIPALATFIKECRLQADDPDGTYRMLHAREEDPSWVLDYMVSVHASITTWKKTGLDIDDLERLTEEKVRCSPAARGTHGSGRRDHVWFERSVEKELQGLGFDSGMEVGRLELVMTVIDHKKMRAGGGWPRYSGALIEPFRLRGNGVPDEYHGMYEVESWPKSNAKRPYLGKRRFYNIASIKRSAHLVPAGTTDDDKNLQFINNTADWEQYNTLYDPDFQKSWLEAARKYSRPPYV